jgi:hypothetical protein
VSAIGSNPIRPRRRPWAAGVVAAALALGATGARAQAPPAPAAAPAAATAVTVVTDAAGSRLQVDGRDFMVFGMNWDYIPIGDNYLFDLWSQPDAVIEAALAREMPLLKDMGVNTVRMYVGVPPRWVRYLHDRYGIYTILNHPVARYGYTLDGVWMPNTDYSNPRLRAAVTAEITELVDRYRGTPGVLMWLLGNENNYGLSWTTFEAEALPEGERDAARARALYSLFGELIQTVKQRDPGRPVAIANGDVQYIDIIAQECKGLDIFGTNCYRGVSARDLFQVVKDKLGAPVLFTEFGADAWNAREMREDQVTQARYLLGQWREIYEQSSGKGRVGNAVGGCIFQWSDGWWKFGQDSRLDIHDTNASWPNGGYREDFVDGENNMNEEWWGICAKGPADDAGLFELYPRAAFYALRSAFRLDPYAPGTDLETIRTAFAAVDPVAAALEARSQHASLQVDELSRVRVSGMRLDIQTYSTGGHNITTPPAEAPQPTLPAFRGFDHLESFWTDFEVRPAGNVLGTLSLSVLGHVPVNPIDEIFYENRGRQRTIVQQDGSLLRLEGIERVKVYRAGVSWDDRWFRLDAFYRVGHTHWGYEGDFFGLYRDAFYGPNVDIYNGEAPTGLEFAGKKTLEGLKVAFGPELHWGANPSVMVKYRRKVGAVQATGMYVDEFAEQSTVTSSIAVPLPPTRKATLQLETARGPVAVSVGGIWSGSTKIDEDFQVAEPDGDTYRILRDYVRGSDTWGGKVKVAVQSGRWNWYAQGAAMGLVADAGPTAVTTFTGWSLKDVGSGNQTNAITGLAVNLGKFQVGPNFLWQKPIVGPVPGDVPSPGRPRNVLDDPFAVRGNRETVAGELLLCYDPTPATWMWAWDNDVREDADLAASLGLVVRHLPTTQDAAIGVLANGNTFAFPGAPPPRDLWELRGRVVSKLSPTTHLVAHAFAGTGEPNGNDARLIHRYGADARLAVSQLALATYAKFNDWGPYDYHRDFNLTFPVQLMGDISYSLGTPRWFDFPQTRLGVRTTWRSLDQYSPRYDPGTGNTPETGPNGSEWELRTYLSVTM